jgi:hypothetical protein
MIMKVNAKNIFLAGALVALTIVSVFAFNAPETKTEAPKPAGEQYMMVTSIESIIPGGFGRSRMFVTDASGNMTEETKMKNFYSVVGINMGNMNQNDAAIVKKINQLSGEGWELYDVSTGVQSPSKNADGANGEGIYMTRYLFRK